ncbi:MAG: thiamine pyrophosphate-binding protein [Thermoanaerobaculia bacterium]
MNGGDLIAQVLGKHGVRFLFTLCGGHISPILVGAKRLGIRVVDVRHEATAVFAADAVARLSGTPGVAAVTAGPGVTNTITALKNAQLAQSPVLVLGGATGTILKGRGALQDIDQLALVAPHVKWATTVRRVRDLVPALQKALDMARSGVPGPVFVECPLDLLYDEDLVRGMYGAKAAQGKSRGLGERALGAYLRRHVNSLFAAAEGVEVSEPVEKPVPEPSSRALRKAVKYLAAARRPVLMVGSQALLENEKIGDLAAAVERLGVPVYLSGMARGLLGPNHPLQLRHKRRNALRQADLVLLAGVPCDFRLDYGRQIGRRARLISVNRSVAEVGKNRRPTLGAVADPGLFLVRTAQRERRGGPWSEWLSALRERDEERAREIAQQAKASTENLNPIAFLEALEKVLPDSSVLVVDGGDFVATASYVVSPRGPLSWLDPGVFGTLGVGAGFALGAKLCRPEAEVWLLYGDGSCAYSLAEFDTFVRHELPVIAVVGNDASWAQIARDQIELLKDDVGTVLRHTDYDVVAAGYGGKGFRVASPDLVPDILATARQEADAGRPVLINALIGKTDFRKGSISV